MALVPGVYVGWNLGSLRTVVLKEALSLRPGYVSAGVCTHDQRGLHK